MAVEKKKIKLGFFRGVDFNRQIGASDWRIALSMPEFGFETWVYGRGSEPEQQNNFNDVHLIPIKIINLPIINGLYLSYCFAQNAIHNKIDVIICNQGVYLAAVIFKLLLPQSKVILDIRSTPVETSKITRFVFDRYYDLIFRTHFFDAITVITDGMRKELDNKFHFLSEYPTSVWQSGFDGELFNPLKNNSSSNAFLHRSVFVIMFHGSFSQNRGLFEVIRAMRLIKNQDIQDVQFVLIGDGPAVSDLKALVQQLELFDMVSFLPTTPHENLSGLLVHADLGIDPLPDHSWWRNQSSLKVFEYLAMGKPVLATDLPCHQNLSDAVMLLKNNAPSTIADAILEYRNLSKEKKTSLSQLALSDSRKHSWRARAEGLAKFINDEVL